MSDPSAFDFDGDGYVWRAKVTRCIGRPFIELQIISGSHRTTVDIRDDEIDDAIRVLERARDALRAKPVMAGVVV